MQARRTWNLATNHLVILPLALALLVTAVTLVLAGGTPSIRGNDSAPLAQPVTLRPSVGGLDAGTTSVAVNNSTVPQLQGLGVGFDPGFINSTTVQRSWGLGVGFDAGLTGTKSTGNHTVRQLPGQGIGFDPGLTSSETVHQLPGLGIGPTEH